jgi:histidinol-phosphate aminotransferase
LRRFLDLVPADVCVVLDEAYFEYADFGTFDGIALAREFWASGRTNLAVARTFSKAHGLAAERVGYLVAPPPLADAVAAATIPFEVTAAAQAGALASLGASDQIHRRCAHLSKERDRLVGELRQLRYPVPASSANHVWPPIGDESVAFEAHSLNFGCTVLAYPGSGCASQ